MRLAKVGVTLLTVATLQGCGGGKQRHMTSPVAHSASVTHYHYSSAARASIEASLEEKGNSRKVADCVIQTAEEEYSERNIVWIAKEPHLPEHLEESRRECARTLR
jgi:hypothetical protein